MISQTEWLYSSIVRCVHCGQIEPYGSLRIRPLRRTLGIVYEHIKVEYCDEVTDG